MAKTFLVHALEKILTEKDIKKAYHNDLKRECQKTLEIIKLEKSKSTSVNDDSSNVIDERYSLDLQCFILPFQLACQSKSANIIIYAIDCLQKLIAYGYLSGNETDPYVATDEHNFKNSDYKESTPQSLMSPKKGWEYSNNKLIDRVVKVICNSMSNDVANEDVYLQIIKAILTIVTAKQCEVHDSTILLAIRTCYNIHLGSINVINQTTAKATLSQMINLIFTRMETHNADYCFKHCGLLTDASSIHSPDNISKENNGIVAKNEDLRSFMEDEIEMTVALLMDDILNRLEQSENLIVNCEFPDKVALNPENTSQSSANPSAITTNFSDKTGHFYHCKQAYTLKRDAFLVFRALCKLAGKNLNGLNVSSPHDKNSSDDPFNKKKSSSFSQTPMHRNHMIRSKILSLELIYDIIRNGGPVFFVEEPVFKHAICNHLLTCLLQSHKVTHSILPSKSIASPLTAATLSSFNTNEIFEDIKLFEISIQVFGAALIHFKKNMKHQIERFFNEVYLNVLENDFPKTYKLIVLTALQSFCENPQNIVDLYVNYDCDLRATNLFARLLGVLSKMVCSHRDLISSTSVLLSLAGSSGTNNATNMAAHTSSTFLALLEGNIHNHQGMSMNNLSLQIAALNPTKRHAFNQTLTLIRKALACMVSIGKCMSVWCKEPETTQTINEQSSLNNNTSDGNKNDFNTLNDEIYNNDNKYDKVHGIIKHQSKQHKTTHTAPFRRSMHAQLSTEYYGGESRRLTSPIEDYSNENKAFEDGSPLDKTTTSPTFDHLPDDHPTKFEHVKQMKETIEKGIEIFKKNPDKGLQYLQERVPSVVNRTVESVAHFFYNESRLDKGSIGDYLGDNDDFHKEVMYAYVDLMDFKGKDFIEALRFFLDKFKLPGEAQKVDRLMQKFASRYVETTNYGNGVFQTADSAYVLAFSIIMLTTDLHNPQVKRKMTKEEYIRINKSSSDQKDLPEAYLSQIYDQIAENKLNMKDENDYTKSRSMKNVSEFTSATYIEHIRPMFRITWAPMLAAYSVCLQDCDDLGIIEVCLEGMKFAISISCIFLLELERNAYIQALSHFTLLYFSESPNFYQIIPTANNHGTKNENNSVDIFETGATLARNKSYMTINIFMTIAEDEGNNLGVSWFEFFKCISHLELAKIIGGSEENSPNDSFSNVAINSLNNVGDFIDQNPNMNSSASNIDHSPLFEKNLPEGITSENAFTVLSLTNDDDTVSVVSVDTHISSSVTTSSNKLANVNSQTKTSFSNKTVSRPKNLTKSNNNKTGTRKGGMRNNQIIFRDMQKSLDHADNIARQNILVRIDKIFTSSILLDGEAICDFVRALCRVSAEELSFLMPPLSHRTSLSSLQSGGGTSFQHTDSLYHSQTLSYKSVAQKQRVGQNQNLNSTAVGMKFWKRNDHQYSSSGMESSLKRSDSFIESHAFSSDIGSSDIIDHAWLRGRMFSLQKLVEISYYNMARIRLQWSKIWDIMGPHFNEVGCHDNESVAFFALDSLRQLSTKFLEKGELANFRFQKDFLRPFEYIVKNNRSLNIIDMVVRCMDQMIRAQAHNIKSGWKNIFNVFQLIIMAPHTGSTRFFIENEIQWAVPHGSQLENELREKWCEQYLQIIEMAFQSLNYISSEICETNKCDFSINIIDSFQNLIKCLAEFACFDAKELLYQQLSSHPTTSQVTHISSEIKTSLSSFTSNKTLQSNKTGQKNPTEVLPPTSATTDINMEAIRLIRSCADFVYRNPKNFTEYTFEELNIKDEDYQWVKGWFPILFELSCVINRCSLDIRTRALTIMFDVLKSYGSTFLQHWWKDFFKVFFRIFDNMKTVPDKIQKSEWMITTCNHALYAIVDIFSQFYDPLCTTLLREFYDQLLWCLKQGNELLARAALSCLENMIVSNGLKFGQSEWQNTMDIIKDIYKTTQPNELMEMAKAYNEKYYQHSTKKLAHDLKQISINDSTSHISSVTTTSHGDSYNEHDYLNRETGHNIKVRLSKETYNQISINCIIQLELIHLTKYILFYPNPAELYINGPGLTPNINPERIPLSFNGNQRPILPTTSITTTMLNTNTTTLSESKQLFSRSNHSGISQSHSSPNRILFFHCLTPEMCLDLVKQFLIPSHAFAVAFNSDSELRTVLCKMNFRGSAKPHLIKQETSSIELLLEILFTLYEDDVHGVKEMLLRHLSESIDYFIKIETRSHKDAWLTVLNTFLTRLITLPDIKFQLLIQTFYPNLCQLLAEVFESVEIRNLIKTLFLKIGYSHHQTNVQSLSMSTPKNQHKHNEKKFNPHITRLI